MIDRFKRAWAAFKSDEMQISHNQTMRVFKEQSRSRLHDRFAPRGAKLHLLTKDGVATHGEVTDRTLFQFVGFEPLPSTPQWMKEQMVQR
jgi:hypothetical protein